MPRTSAKNRLRHRVAKRHRRAAEHGAVADRDVLRDLLDVADGLVLGMSGGDVGVHRDGALAVLAGDGLERRLLLVGDQRGQGHQIAARRAHLQALQVLGTGALAGEQPAAHVEPAAVGAVLADAQPADQGVEGGRHVLDRHAEVGGARPIREDAQLRHAELVVGVEVDHQAGLAQLGHQGLADRDQLIPLRSAHRELDGKAALRGEALLRQVLHHRAQTGDGVQIAPQRAHDRRLIQLPLVRRHHGDEQDARVDSAGPHHGVEPCHLRPTRNHRLGLLEDVVRLLDRGPDGGLQAHEEAALILRRHELSGQSLEDHERQREQRDTREDDPPGPGERPAQGAGVDPLERGEAVVDRSGRPGYGPRARW